MTIGAYFEPVNEGAILVTPDSCRLTPAGQVFAMFRSHYGNELIAADARPGGADLDVAASVNEAHREVILTLVNLSPEAQARAEVHLANVGGIVAAEGAVLASADFLPESEFVRQQLDVALKPNRTVALVLPRHSVAEARLAYR